jgi:hypothetical protein
MCCEELVAQPGRCLSNCHRAHPTVHAQLIETNIGGSSPAHDVTIARLQLAVPPRHAIAISVAMWHPSSSLRPQSGVTFPDISTEARAVPPTAPQHGCPLGAQIRCDTSDGAACPNAKDVQMQLCSHAQHTRCKHAHTEGSVAASQQMLASCSCREAGATLPASDKERCAVRCCAVLCCAVDIVLAVRGTRARMRRPSS